jgi:hypothetical protein
MERRHFLATSLIAVAALTDTAVANGAPAAAVTPKAASPALPPVAFSEARFRSLVGSAFHFAGDAWRGQLQLTEVVGRSGDARTEQFTTVFRADGRVLPAAGMYEVDHPAAGRFTLRIDGHRESDFRLATFALLRG